MSGARCSSSSRAALAARSAGVSGTRAHACSSLLEAESRRHGLRRGPGSDRYLRAEVCRVRVEVNVKKT